MVDSTWSTGPGERMTCIFRTIQTLGLASFWLRCNWIQLHKQKPSNVSCARDCSLTDGAGTVRVCPRCTQSDAWSSMSIISPSYCKRVQKWVSEDPPFLLGRWAEFLVAHEERIQGHFHLADCLEVGLFWDPWTRHVISLGLHFSISRALILNTQYNLHVRWGKWLTW